MLCISDDLQSIRGRAYATVVIDVATRMILAIYISFREPNADSVLRALKQAILPKEGLLKDIKRHEHYEKPGDRKRRKTRETIRRRRRQAARTKGRFGDGQ